MKNILIEESTQNQYSFESLIGNNNNIFNNSDINKIELNKIIEVLNDLTN